LIEEATWCRYQLFDGAKKVQAFIMRLVFKMSDATFLLCGAKIERIAENNKGKTII
jgi:hypothetical protein